MLRALMGGEISHSTGGTKTLGGSQIAFDAQVTAVDAAVQWIMDYTQGGHGFCTWPCALRLNQRDSHNSPLWSRPWTGHCTSSHQPYSHTGPFKLSERIYRSPRQQEADALAGRVAEKKAWSPAASHMPSLNNRSPGEMPDEQGRLG